MVTIEVDQLRQLMSKKENIRNISIIAHVDHGKTTLTDSLVASAGVIADKKAGTARYTDTRKDEQERCITIKSTAITLHKKFEELQITDEGELKRDSFEILVNAVDSPGHADFSSEVSAALRVTDGAIVVIDVCKGLQAQTYTVIKQAVQEYVVPVLFLNKIDILFGSNSLKTGDFDAQEQIYHKIKNILDDYNNFLYSLLNDSMPKEYRDRVLADVMKGTVMFGSGKLCWAYDIRTAFRFVFRNKLPDFETASKEELKKWNDFEQKYLPKFWGENFCRQQEDGKLVWKKRVPAGEEKHWIRGFNKGILDTLCKICANCEALEHDAIREYLPVQHQKMQLPVDTKELTRLVLKTLFPVPSLLMRVIGVHLPSPAGAQKYRAQDLSMDSSPDGPTTKAIRECSDSGPLVVFCSKKFPQGKDLARAKIFTMCRIFSGVLHPNTKVLVMDDKFDFSKTKVQQSMIGVVQSVNIMIGKTVEPVASMNCGNLCGIKGIDTYLPGPGTLVPYKEDIENLFYPVKNMKFTSVPIVGCRVRPKNPLDLSKLVEASKMLSNLDLTCKVEVDSQGLTIFGVGPLHVEILVKDLAELSGKEIIVEDQIVRCAETVTDPEPRTGMAKSNNKHNRLTMAAYPLEPELTDFIDPVTNLNGFDMEQLRNHQEPEFHLAHVLSQNGPTNFNSDNIRRILHCGDGVIFYNATQGCQYIDDLKSSMCDGLMKACAAGPLCGEQVRGVQFSLVDVVCHTDSVHRGQAQIIPASRNVTMGCLFRAGVTLQEPIYIVSVEGPSDAENNVRAEMNRLGAIEISYDRDSSNSIMQYRLPMAKSLRIQPTIMQSTSGTWTTRLDFDGFELIPGDPWDETSECAKRIVAKRIENKLEPEMRGESHYLDRL